MKRSFICDQGSSRDQEDGLINTQLFAGVLDGVSKPYSLSVPPLKIHSMSSGAWVVRTVEKIFTFHSWPDRSIDNANLLETIKAANLAIDVGLKKSGHNLPKELRPGATFAVAKIREQDVEVAQTGDSFAIVVLINGEVIISPYGMRAFEKRDREIYQRIYRDVALDLFNCEPDSVPEQNLGRLREEFWERYLPSWIGIRKLAINNIASSIGYGLLNGEPEALSMVWKAKFRRHDVQTILCLTDGMVPKSLFFEESDDKIANGVLKIYQDGGLPAILRKVRQEEAAIIMTNYVSHAEATGCAIEF